MWFTGAANLRSDTQQNIFGTALIGGSNSRYLNLNYPKLIMDRNANANLMLAENIF